MKRYLVLALALPVVVAYGAGCKKTVPTVEAGTDIPVAAVDAGVAPVAEVDAGPATPLATTPTAVVTAAKSAKPVEGAFQGSYACFNTMQVTQTGNTVSARQNPGNTQQFTQIACAVSGDTCEGTATYYTQGKPTGTKHVSLKRSPDGNITYKADNEGPTLCRKNK